MFIEFRGPKALLNLHGCRQTAPYSPELEPDIVLTQAHASGVDETCTTFGDRRRWQHSVALGGCITLHWVAELMHSASSPVRCDQASPARYCASCRRPG